MSARLFWKKILFCFIADIFFEQFSWHAMALIMRVILLKLKEYRGRKDIGPAPSFLFRHSASDDEISHAPMCKDSNASVRALVRVSWNCNVMFQSPVTVPTWQSSESTARLPSDRTGSSKCRGRLKTNHLKILLVETGMDILQTPVKTKPCLF